MAIGGQPDKRLDIRREGISREYAKGFDQPIIFCKYLLRRPGFINLNWDGFTEPQLKKNILRRIKDFSSYTEYMANNKAKLAGFLTERGREIVVRLNQIALELRNLYVENPEVLNVDHVLLLLEEGKKLTCGETVGLG